MPASRPNIVLIGFMGTGKSSVAGELAKITGHKVIELDAEIEHAAGKGISEIFAAEGEAGFRDRESSALKAALQGRGALISAGGGAVLREDNVRAMRASGVVVCLWASVEEVWERVKGHGHRPLLNKPDPKAEINRLMKEREPKYRAAAEINIETGGKSPSEIAKEIWEAIKCSR